MRLTVKKEKIYSLIEENKPKTKSQTLNIKRATNESLVQKANSGNSYIGNYNNYYKLNPNNNLKTYYNRLNTDKEQTNLNKNVEYRKNSLKYPEQNSDEIQEITKKLADLKINLCIGCQRIVHTIEDCPEIENEEGHLN